MSELRAGPPPPSLSPDMSFEGVSGRVLAVPMIRGQASSPHQPQ
jgi:hypothetical protein